MEYEAIVIGAGPVGIEVGAGFKRAGIPFLQLERGALAQTVYDWPSGTRYFSAPDWMAVAGVPMQTTHQEVASREEYLAYLRTVVETLELPVDLYREVVSVRKTDSGFTVESRNSLHGGDRRTDSARILVVATGDMSRPNLLGIPGEDLPQVSHYFSDPHLYFGKRVLIVGGRNSAIEAAVRSWRIGAEVLLSYRGAALERKKLYSRLHLEISLLLEKQAIQFYPQSVPSEIGAGYAVLAPATHDPEAHDPEAHDEDDRENAGQDHDAARAEGAGEAAGAPNIHALEQPTKVECDFVLLATGFHGENRLLAELGVRFEGPRSMPVHNPDTMETNVPGVYVAGTGAAGDQQGGYTTFVGTCRHHTPAIIGHAFGEQAAAAVKTGSVRSRSQTLSFEELEVE